MSIGSTVANEPSYVKCSVKFFRLITTQVWITNIWRYIYLQKHKPWLKVYLNGMILCDHDLYFFFIFFIFVKSAMYIVIRKNDKIMPIVFHFGNSSAKAPDLFFIITALGTRYVFIAVSFLVFVCAESFKIGRMLYKKQWFKWCVWFESSHGSRTFVCSYIHIWAGMCARLLTT